MNIRWKNKNPYLNLYRETNRVISSSELDETKETLISSMLKRDYTGNWLFSHPSHKFVGSSTPTEKDDVSKNPYYQMKRFLEETINSDCSSKSKLEKICSEMNWLNYSFSQSRALDWVLTE